MGAGAGKQSGTVWRLRKRVHECQPMLGGVLQDGSEKKWLCPDAQGINTFGKKEQATHPRKDHRDKDLTRRAEATGNQLGMNGMCFESPAAAPLQLSQQGRAPRAR